MFWSVLPNLICQVRRMVIMVLISQMMVRIWSMISFSCWFLCRTCCRQMRNSAVNICLQSKTRQSPMIVKWDLEKNFCSDIITINFIITIIGNIVINIIVFIITSGCAAQRELPSRGRPYAMRSRGRPMGADAKLLARGRCCGLSLSPRCSSCAATALDTARTEPSKLFL